MGTYSTQKEAIIAAYSTQKEAIIAARSFARNNKAHVVIRRNDEN
jgi:hypothetical protein